MEPWQPKALLYLKRLREFTKGEREENDETACLIQIYSYLKIVIFSLVSIMVSVLPMATFWVLR